MKIISILLTLLSATVFVYAVSTQVPISFGTHQFTGKLRTPENEVLAGVNLKFKGSDDKKTVSVAKTDVEGRFSIDLFPDNYEITTEDTMSRKFKAYITISETDINPNEVDFMIEPDSRRCGESASGQCPKLVKAIAPIYPPAARAVRAWGEVVIKVSVAADGRVILAKAEAGHPLLRASSEAAARACEFEPSSESSERQVRLTYVYLLEKKKEGLKYYSNPYRIEKVDTSSVDKYCQWLNYCSLSSALLHSASSAICASVSFG